VSFCRQGFPRSWLYWYW